jgi:uncharacterized protein DUF3568
MAVALCGLMAGCAAAAAAGAGAGAGYYFTTRGVGSSVPGSVDDVALSARDAFAAEGIAITDNKSEDSGDKLTFAGKKGDLDVSVEIKRQGPNETKTEVSARKNLVEWDKAYAQRIMDRIVKGRSEARR